MIVYDFDGTIYNGDSSKDLFKFAIKKKKKLLLLVPKIIIYFFLYIIKIKTKERFKEAFFSFLELFNNPYELIKEFWQKYEYKINTFYLEKNHYNEVIISASPYFLLEPIARKYKIKKLIATDIDIKTGKITGKNCQGKEKVILYKKYFKEEIAEFYTDSLSDMPLIKEAKQSFIVNNGKVSRYKGVQK